MAIQMNLGAFLQHCGISAYRLVKATEGRLTPATVYGLVSKPSQRIDLATVGTVLDVLSELTGTSVLIQDVLEPVSDIEAQRRIAALRHAGAFGGTSTPLPEGEWGVPDQLAELRGRDL
ncbi:hypothetical protein GCM10022631_37230 [Deinococcus rubellus]|uniref:helix-turn-helix domain-containing protein n=1 Tax=Deinococcus rubellus TaxID=1889240 RepID=UPI0031EB286E